MKPRQQDDRPAVVVTAVAQGGVPAASGVSVATGTAGVALLLVVSDEGGIRGPFCHLNRRDRHFPGASPPVASGRLRSPPVASGHLRPPPVGLAREARAQRALGFVRVVPRWVWVGCKAFFRRTTAFL